MTPILPLTPMTTMTTITPVTPMTTMKTIATNNSPLHKLTLASHFPEVTPNNTNENNTNFQ